MSETFVSHQLMALAAAGLDYRVIGWAVPRDQQHPEIAASGIDERGRSYRPMARHPILRGVQLVARAARHPVRVIRTLAAARAGIPGAIIRQSLRAVVSLEHRLSAPICHAHFIDNGYRAILFARLGILSYQRLIVSVHGRDLHQLFRGLSPRGRQALIERVDRFVVNSRYTGTHLEALGCPHDKIVRIPVGLDVNRFRRPPTRPPGGATDSYIQGRDSVTVLSVGRLTEKKGFDIAIKAIAAYGRTEPDGPPLRYRIVGDGPLRARLDALIKSEGVEEAVQLVGPRRGPELLDEYAGADLFLLVSREASDGDREGQGLVLQEAQAMELPVIASDHNGFPDSIIDGATGILVRENDVAATVAGIGTMLSRRTEWREMGRAGRAFVAETFDFSRVNGALQRCYRELTPPDDTGR